ncbi:MAG TPA: hypothetical protein VI112_04210, partial [Bacteroidia bacterium]
MRLLISILVFIFMQDAELVPGKSADGVEVLGAMKDVVAKYGRTGMDSTVVPFWAQMLDGTCDHFWIETIRYKERGLTFISGKGEKDPGFFSVSEAIFRLPAGAHTTEGIVLGKSTMDEVVNIYGKNELHWNQDALQSNAMYYNHRGISFEFDIDP